MNSRQRWSLTAVCIATFMLLLDITVVNVALPDIQESLDASFSDLSGSPDVLNVSRAIQGVGGAIMFATALALLAAESRASSAAPPLGSGARWSGSR